MKIGISTSCFYPNTTEQSLERIATLGFEDIEVFVNAPSESTVSYAKMLKKSAKDCGLNIIAFHPYTSFAESYCLFGSYERRRQDFYEIYKQYFEAAACMGATIFNFHGCRDDWAMDIDRYCEIYAHLYRLAKKSGIRFSQENVNRHYAAKPDFLMGMKDRLGEDICFTMDVKQAKRSGVEPCLIRDAMGKQLIHFHASDYLDGGACALPGQGICCYEDIFDSHLRSDKVSKVIEVYSSDFTEDRQLREAAKFVSKL